MSRVWLDYVHKIDIWEPRYHDSTVLVNPSKIADGANVVIFSKAKHLKESAYYMDGEQMKSYPKESNGKIMCHAIPFDDFEVIPIDR